MTLSATSRYSPAYLRCRGWAGSAIVALGALVLASAKDSHGEDPRCLLQSAAFVLPGIAYAAPAELNLGQCVKAMNDARKADGNKTNGQNNTMPRSTKIQAANASLAEFGICTPPSPTCAPLCGGGGED
jgi:hypothetical protein